MSYIQTAQEIINNLDGLSEEDKGNRQKCWEAICMALEDAPVGIIGDVGSYYGTGIADPGTRTEQIGDRTGDTVKKVGWYVANGQSGTPNMLNKVPRMEASSGVNRGSDDAVVVSHNHTFTGTALGNHTHTFTGSSTTTGNPSANHTHSINHTHGGWYADSGHVHGSSNMFACVMFDTANYIRWIGRGSFTSTSVVTCDIWGGGGNAGVGGVAVYGNTDGPSSSSQPAYSGNSGTVSAWHTHNVTAAGNNSNNSAGTPSGTISTVGEAGTGKNMQASFSLIPIIKMS